MGREWEEFFKNFSYKPNWTFDFVNEIEYGTKKVVMTMKVPDSRKPLPELTPLDNLMGQRTVIPLVPIRKTVVLDWWFGEEQALEYVRWHIMDMENHEIDEWIKYKGELPFDPHKGSGADD